MQIKVTTKTAGTRSDTIVGFAIAVIDAPALTGTPKQIAWAERIRTEAIEDTVRTGALAKVRVGGKPLSDANFAGPEVDAALAQVEAGCASMAAALADKTSAAAWIDALAHGRPSFLTIRRLVTGA